MVGYDQLKVLVVDDFLSMRNIIKNALSTLDINDIQEAPDGAIALDILNENSIDLILSDWNMPGMTGLELLQEVRGHRLFKKIPFIMVTADDAQQNVLDAVKAGVSQYIIKPFTADQLEKKIKHVIRS